MRSESGWWGRQSNLCSRPVAFHYLQPRAMRLIRGFQSPPPAVAPPPYPPQPPFGLGQYLGPLPFLRFRRVLTVLACFSLSCLLTPRQTRTWPIRRIDWDPHVIVVVYRWLTPSLVSTKTDTVYGEKSLTARLKRDRIFRKSGGRARRELAILPAIQLHRAVAYRYRLTVANGSSYGTVSGDHELKSVRCIRLCTTAIFCMIICQIVNIAKVRKQELPLDVCCLGIVL